MMLGELYAYFSQSSAECIGGSVRVLVGDDYDYYEEATNYQSFYTIKDELGRGSVEICLNGSWNAICSDYWEKADASVACKQLGFSSFGAIPVTSGVFDTTRSRTMGIRVIDFICDGHEDKLINCPHVLSDDIKARDCSSVAAGVICQGKRSICNHGFMDDD